MLHQFAQMQAAALVAEPAGDADVPVLIEAFEQFLARPGETVHHRGTEPTVEVFHHRDKILVRIALMQEQRFSGFRRAQF